jgi:hypothetical protein
MYLNNHWEYNRGESEAKTVTYDSVNYINHKECYVMLPAWC